LTWRGRLSNFRSVQYFNYYSSGEEVLATHTGSSSPSLWDAIVADGQLNTGGKYTWTLQEKLKGRMLTGTTLSSTYGGWGWNTITYNLSYLQSLAVPANAALVFDNQLRTLPIFAVKGGGREFNGGALFGSTGHQDALKHRDQYLAEAFPARTPPAGANPFHNSLVNRNFDMQTAFKSGWPRVRVQQEDEDWKHSDLREVAFLYTWPLFTNLVFNGNLK
jgi:hypothetical protein